MDYLVVSQLYSDYVCLQNVLILPLKLKIAWSEQIANNNRRKARDIFNSVTRCVHIWTKQWSTVCVFHEWKSFEYSGTPLPGPPKNQRNAVWIEEWGLVRGSFHENLKLKVAGREVLKKGRSLVKGSFTWKMKGKLLGWGGGGLEKGVFLRHEFFYAKHEWKGFSGKSWKKDVP